MKNRILVLATSMFTVSNAMAQTFPVCANRFQKSVGGPASFTVPVWNAYWNPITAPQAPSNKFGTSRNPTTITYVSHNGVPMTMYLFLPMNDPTGNPWNNNSAEKIPLVVDIHGGGFSSQDAPNKSYAMGLTQAGYAVASLNYRLAPVIGNDGTVSGTLANTFPASIQDVRCAMRVLRAKVNPSLVNINYSPAHIGVFGGSSGGNTASMLGATLDYDTNQYGPNASYLDSSDCPVGVPEDTNHIMGNQVVAAPAFADFIISLSGNLTMNPSNVDVEDGSVWGTSVNEEGLADMQNYFGIGANQPKGAAYQLWYNEHHPGTLKDNNGNPLLELTPLINVNLGSAQTPSGVEPGGATTAWGATLASKKSPYAVILTLSIAQHQLASLLTSSAWSINAYGEQIANPVQYYQQAYPDYQIANNSQHTDTYMWNGVTYPNYNPAHFLVVSGAQDTISGAQSAADFFDTVTNAENNGDNSRKHISVERWLNNTIGYSPNLNVITGEGISAQSMNELTTGVYWYGRIINSNSTAEFWLMPDQGHVPLPFAYGYADPVTSDNANTLSMNLVSCEMLNNLWAYVAN